MTLPDAVRGPPLTVLSSALPLGILLALLVVPAAGLVLAPAEYLVAMAGLLAAGLVLSAALAAAGVLTDSRRLWRVALVAVVVTMGVEAASTTAGVAVPRPAWVGVWLAAVGIGVWTSPAV